MKLKRADILLLGMKKKVAAIERTTGRILWEQKLSGPQGDFVTLLCANGYIYAACGGHLHCLALETGQLLWTNKLPGYGYGLASLCFPDGASAPDAALLAQHQANQAAAAAANSGAATGAT